MDFLGESTAYWIAVRERIDQLGVGALMRELVQANAKVQYYENHLRLMEEFRKV